MIPMIVKKHRQLNVKSIIHYHRKLDEQLKNMSVPEAKINALEYVGCGYPVDMIGQKQICEWCGRCTKCIAAWKMKASGYNQILLACSKCNTNLKQKNWETQIAELMVRYKDRIVGFEPYFTITRPKRRRDFVIKYYIDIKREFHLQYRQIDKKIHQYHGKSLPKKIFGVGQICSHCRQINSQISGWLITYKDIDSIVILCTECSSKCKSAENRLKFLEIPDNIKISSIVLFFKITQVQHLSN